MYEHNTGTTPVTLRLFKAILEVLCKSLNRHVIQKRDSKTLNFARQVMLFPEVFQQIDKSSVYTNGWSWLVNENLIEFSLAESAYANAGDFSAILATRGIIFLKYVYGPEKGRYIPDRLSTHNAT